MCRIAIGPLDSFSRKELTRIFNYLEKSNGGDGNGVWIEGKVEKGLKLTPALIAAKIYNAGKKRKGRFVFHTRLRSVGKVENAALHPLETGSGFLVQNGTFTSWRSYYRGSATTDTMALAELVGEKGLGVLKSSAVSNAGVFVHMGQDNEIIVLKRRKRPFVLHLFDSGRWLYASEDVGWLTKESGNYTVIEFGDDVYWKVDESGAPRAVDIEEVTLSWIGNSYYSNQRGYDDEWMGKWYGKVGKSSRTALGESTGAAVLEKKDLDDISAGESIAVHLLSIAKSGDGDALLDYVDLVEEWLELQEGNLKFSMCHVCEFSYDGCQDHCPMYVGVIMTDVLEAEEENENVVGGSE